MGIHSSSLFVVAAAFPGREENGRQQHRNAQLEQNDQPTDACEAAEQIMPFGGLSLTVSPDDAVPVSADIASAPPPFRACPVSGNPYSEDPLQAIYFEFEGDGSAYVIETSLESLDTWLGVLRDTCDTLRSTCVDYSNSFEDASAKIVVQTEVGTTYWLFLTGPTDREAGDFMLKFTNQEQERESCSSAKSLDLSSSGLILTVDSGEAPSLSSLSPASACSSNFLLGMQVAYYSFQGDGGMYTFDAQNPSFSTAVGILQGDSCAAVSCVVDDASFNDPVSEVTFTTEDGQQYWLIVAGFFAWGDIAITISHISQDLLECQSAESVSPQLSSTLAASPDVGVTATSMAPFAVCGMSFPTPVRAIYFEFQGDGNTYVIGAALKSSATQFGVIEGESCEEITSCVAFSFGFQNEVETPYSQIVVDTESGVHYWLFLTGPTDVGIGDIVITFSHEQHVLQPCTLSPILDLGDTISVTVNNEDAPFVSTLSPASECTFLLLYSGAKVSYFEFEGDGESYSFAATGSSGLHPVLGILQGGTCDSTTCLAEDRPFDSESTRQQVALTTEVGKRYWLIVSSIAFSPTSTYPATGDIAVTIQRVTDLVTMQVLPDDLLQCESADLVSQNGGLVFMGSPDGGVPTTATAPITACPFLPTPLRTVYFEFEGDGKSYVIGTALKSRETFIGIIEGSSCDSMDTCHAVAVDFRSEMETPYNQIVVNTEIGTRYWLFLTGPTNSDVGDFEITFLEEEEVFEPCVLSPILELSDGLSFSGNNEESPFVSIVSPASKCSSFNPSGAKALYYEFQGNGGTYEFRADGRDFPVVVGVLQGDSCASTTCAIDARSSENQFSAEVSLATEDGQRYWLVLAAALSTSYSTGDIDLTITNRNLE